MTLGIIVAFVMKNTTKKPKMSDVFAVFLVALGVALLNV